MVRHLPNILNSISPLRPNRSTHEDLKKQTKNQDKKICPFFPRSVNFRRSDPSSILVRDKAHRRSSTLVTYRKSSLIFLSLFQSNDHFQSTHHSNPFLPALLPAILNPLIELSLWLNLKPACHLQRKPSD